MDYYFWRIAVVEMVKAMKGTKESALVKQNIILAMRNSVKNIKDKRLGTITNTSNDIDFIIMSMDGAMRTTFNIMRDLKSRLSRMSDIKSEKGMHESAGLINQLIKMLQKIGSVAEVTPEVLALLIRKSCNQFHKTNYTNDINKALANLAERSMTGCSSSDALIISEHRLPNHEN